jgi:hypothetical protein
MTAEMKLALGPDLGSEANVSTSGEALRNWSTIGQFSEGQRPLPEESNGSMPIRV